MRRWVNSFRKDGDSSKLEKLLLIVDGLWQNAEVFVKLFSKLDPLAAGKRSARKPLKLKKTIEGALSIFEGEMKSHNISAEVIGPDDFTFPCWPQDIYAIFTNLVDNSFYWICERNVPTRKITIELSTDGHSLRHIDYQDTGPGIEPNLIESEVIFEPGYTTKPNGTGLGLAISGEAADRNGLKLKVLESNEGAHFVLQPKTEDGK